MANLFQTIGQKIKDAALGTYHQFATNDNGQNFRSYQDEEERRRRLQQQKQQQQAAAEAQRRANTPQPPTPQKPKFNPNTLKPTVQNKPKPVAVPVVTAPKPVAAPLPDQQFKGFTVGPGQNKTIFGKNAAWLLPKGNEKRYGVQADRTISTNKDKFVASFDKVDPEFKKVYVAQIQKQAAAGDKAAQASLQALHDSGRMKGSAMDFVEGSNERLYGGLTRGALRTTDLLLPGKNTFGLERLADQQEQPRQFTERGKQGEKAGTVQKGVVDVAAIALPSAKVDKVVEGSKFVKGLSDASRTARTIKNGIRIAPGSLVGSGVDALETRGRGDDINAAKSAGVGLATDIAMPAVLRPIVKLIRRTRGAKAAEEFEQLAATIPEDDAARFAEISSQIPGIRLAEDTPAAPGITRTAPTTDGIRLPTNNDMTYELAELPRAQMIATAPQRGSNATQPSIWPERIRGEDDKTYLKRVTPDRPDPVDLPEDHSAYFNMGKAHDVVPTSLIDSSKTAADNLKGGANAPKFMQAAADGIVARRDPIKVVPTPDGRYKVLDGNGTFTGVTKYNWQNLPVEIIDPKHWEDANLLVKRAERTNQSFQSAMQQAADRLGLTYHAGPVKSVERVLEKGVADYGGDFEKVRDSVRGTMELENVADLDRVLSELAQGGEIDRVKNGYEMYKDGYRDIKVNIKTPDGHTTEIILASPEMLMAKEEMGGHKLYEQVRVKVGDWERAEVEMTELYRSAAQAEDARAAASSGDISVPSTRALNGANGTPVASTTPVTSSPLDDTLTATPSTSKNLSNGADINVPPFTPSIAQNSSDGNLLDMIDETNAHFAAQDAAAAAPPPAAAGPTPLTPSLPAGPVPAPPAPRARIEASESIADLHPKEQEFVKDYAEMLKGIDDAATGGQMIPNGEGGYIRISEHSPFYRDYFKEYKRAPSRAAWEEHAYNEVKAGRAEFQDEFDNLDTTPEPAKLRGFIENMRSQPKLDDEIKGGIGGKYDPISNAESFAKADEIIAKDPEAAVTRAKTDQRYSLETQALSIRLIDQLQNAGRYQDAIDVIEATAARATEAGQATQILSAYNRLTPEGILQAAQREITNAQKIDPEKYKDLKITPEQAENLRSMAEAVQAMPEGREKALATRQLLDEISRVVPTPGARKFTTIWKAGLLTGVKGAIGGNFVGNATASILRKIADVPASMIDTVLAQATGHRSKVFTLKGLLGGFGEGLKVGARNFKEGVGAADEAVKLDYKPVHFGTGPAGRFAQKYTDTVFNFYSAADRPFYHSALENNLRDLAIVEARNAGLTGKEARDFIAQTVKEPPEDIITQAVQAAEDATFKGKNALGAALSGAKKGLADKGGAAGEIAGEVLMPFTGVPAAIAKHVYDYSPAGAVVNTYKAIKQAANGNFDQAMQRRLSEALGRGITGTGVMWIGAQLHNDGLLTLGFPSDPDERALWESEGKTPYSIKIGGRWRSMNYTGSIMSLMAIGGQVNQAGKDGTTGLGSIAQGVASSGKAIIGSTPLQGVQGGIDALTEPERYGEKFVNNTAGSTIPTIIKDIATAFDPLQRQVNSPADAIQNRIPGARNGLAPKTDVFGEDLPRATSAVGAVIDPFKSSVARDTDLSHEMRRLQDAKLGISPPKIDKKEKFDGVETELDAKLQDELKRRTNNTVKQAWAGMLSDPNYQGLSDADKKKALENISGDIAAVERRRFSADHQLGQYAPGFTGKPTKLSGKQDALLQGYENFDPANYTSTGSTKIVGNISRNGKATLTKVEAMPTEERTTYLKDPKNNYQYQLSKYENDFKGGKLTAVDQYEKVQELGKLKIQSNYSKEAIELYGLSKTKLNDFLKKSGGAPQKVLDEVLAMDKQLADEGYISKTKLGGAIGGSGGSGGSGSSKKKSPPAPKFGSFRLVDAPKAPSSTMESVMQDLLRAFGDIKILQGMQIAPGSDSSEIKIAV